MKLSKPILQTFKLTTDPDGVAEVTIRQAREGENIERNGLFSKTRYITTGLESSAEQDINSGFLRRKEAYLTLARVSGFTDDNDVELFRSKDENDLPSVKAAMTETEFNRAWARLETKVAREIIKFVYEVNPDWSPTYTGE